MFITDSLSVGIHSIISFISVIGYFCAVTRNLMAPIRLSDRLSNRPVPIEKEKESVRLKC